MTVLTTLDGTLKQCYECIADSEEFSLIDVSAVDPVNRLKRVLIGQNLSPPLFLRELLRGQGIGTIPFGHEWELFKNPFLASESNVHGEDAKLDETVDRNLVVKERRIMSSMMSQM